MTRYRPETERRHAMSAPDSVGIGLVIARIGKGRVRDPRRRPRTVAWLALSVILASAVGAAGASGPRAAIPPLERCTFLELRIDEGWWLQVRRSEPAAYGYGALPQRVVVKAGTFTLDEVYRAVIDHVVAPYPDAAVTVVFGPMAAGFEGRVFALRDAKPLVSELMATAYREGDRSLDDRIQQNAIRALDPFWTRAPFLQ